MESFVSASDAGLCDEQRRSRMNSELNTEESPIRISSFWRLRLDWEHSIEVQCNLLDIIKCRSVPVVHIVNSDFKGVARNAIQSTADIAHLISRPTVRRYRNNISSRPYSWRCYRHRTGAFADNRNPSDSDVSP